MKTLVKIHNPEKQLEYVEVPWHLEYEMKALLEDWGWSDLQLLSPNSVKHDLVVFCKIGDTHQSFIFSTYEKYREIELYAHEADVETYSSMYQDYYA